MSRGASLDLVATLPGLATVSTGLTRLTVSLADWTPFWVESFAPFFYRAETELFAGGGSGKSWAPLSPQYAKWKRQHGRGGGILIASGALKASLTHMGGPNSIFQPSAT